MSATETPGKTGSDEPPWPPETRRGQTEPWRDSGDVGALAALLAGLDEADQLETAMAVARRHGLSVGQLLAHAPPRSPEARAIADLYLALAGQGLSATRIAELTGRHRDTVRHRLRAFRDPAWRERRRAARRVGRGSL